MYCVLGIMRTVGQTVTARTLPVPSAQGQALENRNQLLFKWREACNKGHKMKRQPSRVNFSGPRPTQLASELESYIVQSPRMYSNTHQTAEKHYSIPDLYTSPADTATQCSATCRTPRGSTNRSHTRLHLQSCQAFFRMDAHRLRTNPQSCGMYHVTCIRCQVLCIVYWVLCARLAKL